jgi:2-polyprenyl-6-methoxyphenol hydroxylase-like FAD-dependent oxidoreductase
VADVFVVGAGLGGLLTALLLGDDGHRVTVLDRDPDGAPADVTTAWDDWTRRGVPQFRQLFYLLPRFRQVAERELPRVVSALEDVALRHQPLADVSAADTKLDAEIVALTARRPTVEAAVGGVAEAAANVEVRRGVAVRGLVTAPMIGAGIPHVTGVATDHGHVAADLVVDATGRRSPLSQWLTGIGVQPMPQHVEDSGFVYHSRHFQARDAKLPALRGPLLQHFGSLSALTLPAEAGTWGVGLITSSRDHDLRSLHRPDRWAAVVAALGPVAHWTSGDPISDVDVMTRLEDRRRTICPGRQPLITGVVPVADAWASTNPTLGRGTTLALLHAVALRDTMRTVGLADPAGFAVAWHDVTERELGPAYDAIVEADRHRLAEIDAALEGVAYDEGDVAWRAYRMLEDVAHLDAELLRGWFRIAGLVAPGIEVFGQPGFLRRLARAARRHAQEPAPMTRDQLVAIARA